MRETGSKTKMRSMKKFRGVGWGYVIRNQISPDFQRLASLSKLRKDLQV